MLNIRRYTAIPLASILFSIFVPSAAHAVDSSEAHKRPSVVSEDLRSNTNWAKIKITITPPQSYWEEIAKCETNTDWKNRGSYAGGLGIYTKGEFGDPDMGTWERWGGEQFAPSPDKATKEQQITVANRIAVLGWKTTIYRDPKVAKQKGIPVIYEYDKKPVGFTGWGCVKSKSTGKWRIGLPDKWKKHAYVYLPTNKSMYCKEFESMFYDHGLPVKLFSYIAWRESRCQPTVIGWNYHAGMNHLSCKQVTPSCHAVKSYDSGLLQINSTWRTLTSQICKSIPGDLTVLKKPTCNIRVAKYLYENTSGRLSNWNIKLYPN